MNGRNQVIINLFWKFMERGGVQVVTFIVQIVLARLLSPSDYGITSIITVFINIATVFIQSGLGSALIQKMDPDEEDYSTVFYINITIAILLIVILYFVSPWIADFYEMPVLTPVLRACSWSLLFNAFWHVHIAILQKNLEFKKLFYANLGAALVSGTVGVAAALCGYGVWALVIQQLLNSLVSTVIIWILVPWRPKRIFSFKSFQELFGFGSKLLVSNLLDTIYENLQPLIIGKFFTQSDLGYYNQGRQIPNVLVNNLNRSIQGVMFPVFSENQQNPVRLKQLVRRSIVTSCFLVFPMMAGLAAVAKPAIVILLTEKWLPSVPYMQISCIVFAMWPIHTANLQAINAMGRSDIFLKLEVIKKVLGVLMLVIAIPFGIMAILWGTVFTGILGTFINAWPNRRLLTYSYMEQIRDILP
ncbi:MAG: lipopolysaccharide biosynthesis protein, partial [Eubacteriaceae bacterium]